MDNLQDVLVEEGQGGKRQKIQEDSAAKTMILQSLLYHIIVQYASGIRRGRTREEAVPVEGTEAANSEAFSQEIVPIHQGSGFSLDP